MQLRTAELAGDVEISLLDVFSALGRRRRFIAAGVLLAVAAAAPIAFLIPPIYTAEAVILPPQQEPSSQAMLMGSIPGLGALGALAGGSSIWRNPAELYIGVLKSRTIADALIARLRLQSVYGTSDLTLTRKKLERRTSITTGRDSLIHISVEDRDRNRAAALANAYVDELYKQNSRLALTSASQRRLFFDQQLATEKNALADAEIAFKKMQQSSGLVFPTGQSEALIRAIAQVRAEIASREVQLQSIRLYAADQNPQVLLLQREIAGLREQLSKLEAGGAQDSTMVPARKLPEAGLEQIRRLRDLKYHETLFELLAKQYEAARIDEARLSPVLQVVDNAVPPDRKSWPPRALLILVAAVLAGIGCSIYALVRREALGG